MSTGLQIRAATADDAGSISAILIEAFSELRESYTAEAFKAVTPAEDEIVRRLDEGPIWVAEKDGEILGTVSAVPEPEWLYIRSMAVRPNVQGLGVVSRLLNAVE